MNTYNNIEFYLQGNNNIANNIDYKEIFCYKYIDLPIALMIWL